MTTKWTPEQEAVFDALRSTSDSILIDAVAGSGKTTTLVHGVRYLTGSVLALAFNVKIKKTLEAEINDEAVTCKTLNGLGHSALLKYFQRGIKIDTSKTYKILKGLFEDSINAHLFDEWSAISTMVSRSKAHGLIPASTPGRHKALVEDTRENWYEIADHYGITISDEGIQLAREALRLSNTQAWNGICDFDDQIYLSACWPAPFPTFDNVIVDEAQDLSAIQHVMLRKTLNGGGRLIAVGDPNQAIYGFRGAMSDSIALLIREFSLVEMGLTVSFRCSKAVILAAQAIVPRIQSFDGALPGSVTRLEEPYTETIFSDGDAILCRNNGPLIRAAYRLIGEGRGVYVAGRDIGAGLKALIKNLCGKKPSGTMEELVTKLDAWFKFETSRAEQKLQFSKVASIEDKYESLNSVIDFSSARDPAELIIKIDGLFGKESAPITLSSIHRAKGMEWDTVFWLDDKLCPSKWAIRAYEADPDRFEWMMQEEQNITYVATTRARDRLIFIESSNLELKREQ